MLAKNEMILTIALLFQHFDICAPTDEGITVEKSDNDVMCTAKNFEIIAKQRKKQQQTNEEIS